jgi:hypothetical protein
LGKVIKLESKPRTAPKAKRLQSSPVHAGASKASPLTPELKDFIDRAIVPALVKKYLALADEENELAERASHEGDSVRRTAAPGLRGREVRP